MLWKSHVHCSVQVSCNIYYHYSLSHIKLAEQSFKNLSVKIIRIETQRKGERDCWWKMVSDFIILASMQWTFNQVTWYKLLFRNCFESKTKTKFCLTWMCKMQAKNLNYPYVYVCVCVLCVTYYVETLNNIPCKWTLNNGFVIWVLNQPE